MSAPSVSGIMFPSYGPSARNRKSVAGKRCVLVFSISIVVSTLLLHADVFAGLPDVVESVQPKIVKIYGTGGLRGLESYQSGFLVSSDGYVVTAWSYVLDPRHTVVVLNDGRRFQAELIGHDPHTEIAVLKIDATDLAFFDLESAREFDIGTSVLAFSNLYGVATGNEPVSVQQGIVAAIDQLDARRGTYETPYHGQVLVLDAMTNNAGAAGGALTDRYGRVGGMLGKELRSAVNNTWLNYALPVSRVADSVGRIQSGEQLSASDDPETQAVEEPATMRQFGISLVHDVLFDTPPFIERVRDGSLADRKDVRGDDLIVMINGTAIRSCRELRRMLSRIDRDDPVQLTLQRQSRLLEVTLENQPR